MIIRSQDRETITTDLNLTIYEELGSKKCEITNGFSGCLGEYSTKEKAIKVLDMIQKEYLKHIYGAGGEMATRDIYISPFAFIPPKVFQMPADEEVEE